ncbi:hypothetical protein Mkiyose1665_15740 [Mycobacterium kiyosense]|uniref:non-specific serine/threonine protein kinase n=1 Tax=Mycobacterium kiyosense TaxID=2871094 RepID=A0A9P3Q675_9MYCO|nr:hypothetical protein MKCMC460_26800 [Mycobacterium sp. 20KCMC460]GLB84200.1 hypothetical protein SRL2020028_34560 [Mycobacterium kiyosense]GLB90818.1 hypothetical protein SRL2020130_36350 [Mycobacterium kiyosense]GLB94458.1 hypothetical protein SRL2020226_12340 [Mycobacterium kiyosense]GLC00860.1 hypothetical protein SRL2020400_14510 [Mycobacterium kiyosense]
MDQDRAGTQFGPYRLIRLLGSGGYGEVYEAEDTAMHRVVALKLLSSTYSQNPVFRERLFREARTAGRLREPHVLPIHSCGEIDGQVYLDMRLVRGVDLDTLLQREGPLDPARAVAIVEQVAGALDAAHAESVIHRDVKPANILLSGNDFASLVDFGLANAAGDARLTRPGKAVGTFDYVAPERLNGSAVDHRCDVYALACVLYELVTGTTPYADYQDLPALMNAQLSAPIPRASERRAGLPPELDDVIARGMAKDPAARYPSAGELASAARLALGQTPSTPPPAPTTQPWSTPAGQLPGPARPAGRKPRRRTVIALAAAAFVAAAVAAAVFAVVHRSAPSNSAAATPRPSSTVPTTLQFPAMPRARGVAVDGAGNVYATELGKHAPEGRVLKLAPGRSAPAELTFGEIYAEGVAVDAAGNVYIADLNGPAVWKLQPGARGPTRVPFGHLSGPVGVAVAKDGSVYVTDPGSRQVLKLPAGASSPTALMPTTPLNAPVGIAVDGDGNLYFTDSGDRRVLKLPPGSDTPVELPFPGLQAPYGVAVDSRGNVYVTDMEGRKVLKLAAGTALATPVNVAALNYPFGVAVDKNGDLYVVDCHRSDDCANGKVLQLGTTP